MCELSLYCKVLAVSWGLQAGVPLQPMEINGGAHMHLQPPRASYRSRWMPNGVCDPVGMPCWSRLLAGPVAPCREEPTLEQVCWQSL